MIRGRGARARTTALAVQALLAGVAITWITIPASSIVLESYGSGAFPATYVGAAAVGAATTALLGRALRRRPLAHVLMHVLVILTIGLAASWAGLARFGLDGVAVGLLVFVPVLIPVNFVFLVGQAGALLDVRALKSLYPRVIAGFALGVVAGGLVAPLLLALLGPVEHLLLAAAITTALLLVVVRLTTAAFPAELATVHAVEPGSRPTLRSLLSSRFVVLIMAFQMLSAVESQWLDYLVFDRAARRYTDAATLATFVSRFMSIAYGADVLFLLLLAGFLLRRHGLRYGLSADPLAVCAGMLAVVATAALRGSGATIVFVLVVATRVSDIMLGDATARTSIGAAYQAVSSTQRQAAQATVEGLGVPVAIGFSGLVLMLLRATTGTGGAVLPLLTSAVVAGMFACGVLVYRGYGVNLLANLRHRTLHPADVALDTDAAYAVVHRLIASDDPRDVRVALDALAAADHPSLPDHLDALASGGPDELRVGALHRLADTDAERAAAVARRGLRDSDAHVRAASVRVLAQAGSAADEAAIDALAADEDDDVQLAVAVAMSATGDAAHRSAVMARIGALAGSAAAHERILAARILQACAGDPGIDRSALAGLLTDRDADVIAAAVAAVRCPDDSELLPLVVDALADRRTAAVAVEALVGADEHAHDIVAAGLRSPGVGGQTRERLIRVCRLAGGTVAAATLHAHVGDDDRDLGLLAMSALAELMTQADDAPPGVGESATTVLRSDIEHAARVAHALSVLDDVPDAQPLQAALRDEFTLCRRRVLAALALRHGADRIAVVDRQLAGTDGRSHARAMEWLDVTLSGDDRAAFAVLEPAVSSETRLRELSRSVAIPSADAPTVVRDIAEDPDAHWRRPWIRACALVAAARMPGLGVGALDVRAVLSSRPAGQPGDDIVAETLEALRSPLTAIPMQDSRRESSDAGLIGQ